jgi:acyl carrier protein
MGLDTVELVMAVEKHFLVRIPDKEAATLVTVGMLHTWVLAELRRLGRAPVDADRIYSELRELIAYQTGVDLSKVVPDATFVNDLRMD